LAEAKNTLSKLIDAVEAGEEIIITRHGKPAARIGKPPAQRTRAEIDAAVERMRAIRAETLRGYGPVPTEDIITWKREGQR
jgi:antitoxin (DNA-binding transcriptional repressor) of toxin-antitoxin stability system